MWTGKIKSIFENFLVTDAQVATSFAIGTVHTVTLRVIDLLLIASIHKEGMSPH